jgi:hypothetical protein
MTLASQVRSWMRAITGRTRMENEMDAELRFHIQAYAEDLQRKGVAHEEAMRRAGIEFGGVERAKEECRDARGVSFTETLLQDLRYGARALRKSPGFTAIAVLTLALGIGANTAIFSVVNAILLHPLAYTDADRLVTVLNDGNGPISVANYIDWRNQSHSFEAVGAAEYWSPNLTGVDQPENIRGHKITYDLFPLLGAQPLLGRLFTEADDRAGSEHEVILSYRLWQRRFSSDRNVIGNVIRLNNEAYSIVGVMPRDFQFAPFWATNAELWVPIAFGDRVHNRAGNSLRVFGRLKPGARVETVTLDGLVVLFLFAITVLTSIGFGLAPALQASAVNLSDTLKETGRGSSDGMQRNRLRTFLVASEFALALMLLIGAGLMVRSFFALQSVDPGFNPHNVLSMVVSVAGSQEAAVGNREVFYRQLLERVRAIPGVESVAGVNHLPLAGDLWGWPFRIEGRPKPRPGDQPGGVYRIATPGYFRTMKIPLLRGRDIAEADTGSTPGVVVINEKAAHSFWPGEDPIGKRISFDADASDMPTWLTIVGIVKDAKEGDWTATPDEEVYLAAFQNRQFLGAPESYSSYITLVVRTTGDPAALTQALKDTVWLFDRNLPISQVLTMDAVVADANAQPRFEMLLLGIFAAVAVLLAAAATRRNAEGGARGTGIDCASPSRTILGLECRPQLRSGPTASRGGRCRADAVVAAGRREHGAVDCVRECGEPAAGARDFAGTRTCDARGVGSGADPAGAPRPDRERGARRLWRNARSFNSRAWYPAVCGVLARGPSEGRGNSA